MAKKKGNLNVLQEIFRSNNIYGILYSLKKLNYTDSAKKIKQASKHPIVSKTLWHESSLPKKYSNLRNKSHLPFSDNLEGELAWFVQSILKFAPKINDFIEISNNVEVNILAGNYQTASDLVTTVNEEISYSFWGIENNFSLTQLQYGDESNWALLKHLNGEVKDFYTMFFNGIYSKKAESEMTLLQYKRGIETEINPLSPEDSEYLLFKLGYFFTDDYSQYAYILHTENQSPVIDKYITLIEILVELSNTEAYIPLVQLVISDIELSGIKDFRIDRLKELCGFGSSSVFSSEIISLFDKYSIADYEYTIAQAKVLLIKYPYCLEIYQIYVESLIESEYSFEHTNISPLIDEILENLYSVFIRDKKYFTSRENILKIYLTFPKINFFKQLLSLVSIHTGIKSSKNILHSNFYIYSRYSNPSIILFKEELTNLFNFVSEFESNLSFKINKSIAVNSYDELSDYNLPYIKREIYKARGNFLKQDYQKTIFILENLYQKSKLNSYREEEVINLLFHSNFRERQIDKCISLVVNSFFKNKFYIERLPVDMLYNDIIDNDYNILPSIDLPIFFHISSASYYQQYASLDIFLNSIDVTKPSEIDFQNTDFQKKVFLLDKISRIEVLNYFYSVFINDDEIFEERKEILRKLTLNDKTKSNFYLEELAAITQREKINNTIQYVNTGKIQLNFSRIKDNRDINLENNFNRFIKFREFTRNNNLALVDTQVLIENYLSELNTDSSKLQDASFVLFKSVFFEIIEHFLFSEEHGLDGDISTRIRHGVLENQIRKIFLNTNLIALKNKKSIYEDINYWNDYGENNFYKKEIIVGLQDILKKFSKLIDDNIDFIVNELMQVYSNRYVKKNKGLFNYNFSEEFLWIFYKETTENIKDYDEFLNFSFDIIKAQTDVSLVTIREYFHVEVNNIFNKFLDDLEEDVKKIFPHQADMFSELFQIINNTRVLVQKELDLISDWFKDSNHLIDYSLDILTIIETSVESINLIQASNRILANIDVQSDALLEGFDYYIVIMGILLDNILKHGNLETQDIIVDIYSETKPFYIEESNSDLTCLLIQIKNTLGDINEADLILKFLEIKENWKTSLDKVNTEGGSGFQKIKRLLKYDIAAFDSEFDFIYENSELTIQLKIFLFYKKLEE